MEHDAELISTHLVGKDGLTPYQRLFGKPYKMDNFEFGEQVYYARRQVTIPAEEGSATADARQGRAPRKANIASMDAKWGTGTWLGQNGAQMRT